MMALFVSVTITAHNGADWENHIQPSILPLIFQWEKKNQKAIIDRKSPQPGNMPQTFADITKAQEKLDYNPQVNIEQGIAKFTQWLNRANDPSPAE